MRYLDLPTRKRYSVIGLGTWQFGSREWGYGREYDEHAAGEIVARARALGITVFDTAEIYGFGRSERILGRALRESGGTDDVVVATKVFPVLPTAPIVQQRGVASAHRLGVRVLDLYQVHQPHPLIGDATTMRGMRALRDVGLVDDVGVSNYRLSRWQRAEAALGAPVLSNQVQFSLVARGPMEDLLPWAQRTGHLVMAYSPLGQGLLSGRYSAAHRPSGGVRAANAMFLPENLDAAAPVAVAAARDRRGARRHRRAGGARLARAPTERRGDPRRVERRPGREQRRRGRRHPRCRRVRGADNGRDGVPPTDRRLGDSGPGTRPPLAV